MYTHTFVLERTIKVYTCVCLCCIKKRGRNSGKCAQHFLCRTGGDGGSGNWGAGKGICRETLVYTFYIFWFLNNNLLPIQKLNLKISTILLRCRLTNCSRPTLWLTLSFFFLLSSYWDHSWFFSPWSLFTWFLPFSSLPLTSPTQDLKMSNHEY